MSKPGTTDLAKRAAIEGKPVAVSGVFYSQVDTALASERATGQARKVQTFSDEHPQS
jgi:hypothetical protein